MQDVMQLSANHSCYQLNQDAKLLSANLSYYHQLIQGTFEHYLNIYSGKY